MYKIKLFTSTGSFIGDPEEIDIDDALEIVKGHIENNDTIAVISDSDYIEGIEIVHKLTAKS